MKVGGFLLLLFSCKLPTNTTIAIIIKWRCYAWIVYSHNKFDEWKVAFFPCCSSTESQLICLFVFLFIFFFFLPINCAKRAFWREAHQIHCSWYLRCRSSRRSIWKCWCCISLCGLHQFPISTEHQWARACQRQW